MDDNTGADGVKLDLAGLVRGAVARGWCSPENAHKEMDVHLAEAIAQEVCAAINTDAIAALVGAGQAVVARWDSTDWKAPPTADAMSDLRTALARLGGGE
jgi:hypothetical protein